MERTEGKQGWYNISWWSWKIFEQMKQLNLPNVEMKYLSMGMSNSYQVAIAEGANIVRIGTKIFGERD